MCVLRLLVLGLTGCAVLTGCGTSHLVDAVRTPGTVAEVGNATISKAQIQAYIQYALQFYSWVDTSGSGNGTTGCSVSSPTPACGTLRRQVLRRLLEERIVAEYAAQRGIRLSPSDSKRVEVEMTRLQSPHSGTQRLFSTERVSPQFMRSILRNQILVKHVEAAVVGRNAFAGPSFRVRKYIFGIDRQSYKSAINFATGGVSTASGQTPPVHWVAAYRLPTQVRSQADVAGRGDYVGPTLEGGSYVVYQILGHGVHRYGLPARQQIEARSFRLWLAERMSQIQPKCFQGPVKTVPCARLYH
jgi:hypothetical protein